MNNFFKSLLLVAFLLLFFSCSMKANYNPELLPDKIVVEKESFGISVMRECCTFEKGFIFYPGGLVEPDAYIPLMAQIADRTGAAVFIVKMPFNLAVLNKNGADKVFKDYGFINEWYISGHSLGGVMASSYVYNNPEIFNGLVLLASYPQESENLANFNLEVLSLKGSMDGLVKSSDFNNSKTLLPSNSIFVDIEGGNHAQFGNYGFQKDDMEAHISSLEQQTITAEYIFNFIVK